MIYIEINFLKKSVIEERLRMANRLEKARMKPIEIIEKLENEIGRKGYSSEFFEVEKQMTLKELKTFCKNDKKTSKINFGEDYFLISFTYYADSGRKDIIHTRNFMRA